MDMYREIILDHYKHPRNFGHLSHVTSTAHAYNATCGDKIIMEILVGNDQVKDVRFSGIGCAISQASASMLTGKVMGMKISDVMKLSANTMFDMLGTTLTPSRVKCATLPLEVLQKAVVSLK